MLRDFSVQSVFYHLGDCGTVDGDICPLEPFRICDGRDVRICVITKGSVVNSGVRGGGQTAGDSRVVPNSKVSPPQGSCCPLVVMCEPFREENLDHGCIPGRSQP